MVDVTSQPENSPEKPGLRAADGKTDTAKIIKRYANRKLYDTQRSKYVTLEEIAEMIKLGEDVQIIDNKNKADLTSATLAQIIFEAEKKQSKMPLSMLRNLIQSSGEALGDFFDKNVKNPVETARDSAQKSAEEIFQGAAQLRSAATRGVTEFTDTARQVFGKAATDIEDERVDEIAAAFAPAFAQIQEELGQQIEAAQDNGSAVIDPLIERLSQSLYEVRLQMAALHEAAKKPQTTGKTQTPAADTEASSSDKTL
jgi:polyhydroxyalkanoate synthesis repressor PhaR